jgi:hypothetical protein
MQRRTVPPLQWRAVLLGLALAVVIGYAAHLALAPIPGSAATIVGIGAGGFLAGKQANAARLYHGAVVGLLWILLETFALVPTVQYSTDLATDTLIVIGMDAASIVAGSLGGSLARSGRASSSDTGTGR